MSPIQKVKKNKRKIISTMVFLTMIFSCFSVFYVLKVETVKAGASTNDFSYHVNLTVDNTYVTGTHTDFPVLVYNTSCDILDGLDNNDFTFFDTSGEEMDWELVSWDDSSDTLEAWVRFNLTGGTDTFELHYENTGDTGESDGGEHNPTDVWDSDFLCVYHMDDADGGLDDSTTNTNDAAEGPNGVDAADYHQTGQIGYGVRLDGTSTAQDFTLPADMAPNEDLDDLTVNVWMKSDGYYDGMGIFDFTDDGCTRQQIKPTGGELQNRMAIREGDSDWITVLSGVELQNGSFHFIGGRHVNTGTIWAYHNGSYQSTSFTGFDPALGQGNNLGSVGVGNANGLDGSILDEFWISNTDRGDNWWQTVYNMTSNNTLFLIYGPEIATSGSICELILHGNPASNYTFTLQGEQGDTVWANSSGDYFETGEFNFTIYGIDYFERLTINVSDINDTEIDGNDIYISISATNSSYTNWHQCSNGGEQIIVNKTNWDTYNWMNGANPFTADGDSDGEYEIQSTKSIWLRIRINIPNDATQVTHAKFDMTWDAGAYN